MRVLKAIGILLLVICLVYFLGPKPAAPEFNTTLPAVPSEIGQLEDYVKARESSHRLKPGNEARIVWSDTPFKKTPYAIVYLHGFSASSEEGNPLHTNIAKAFSCNLYLSRLAEHGIDTTEALVNLTADNLWESAKQAYNIGRHLGDKVILMGTSTGGSLALQLASTYPDVAAIILLSPNIAINDPNAWLINNPWGLQIARLVKGSKYNYARNDTELYKRYWYYQYRLEAAMQLQEYLESAMTSQVFNNVRQPVLTLYYYKNENEQDPVVKVSAMQQMMSELSTPNPLKKEVAIPDADNHVLGSYILSQDIDGVQQAISQFMRSELGIKPAFAKSALPALLNNSKRPLRVKQ